MRIALLGAAFSAGGAHPGCRHAPDVFRDRAYHAWRRRLARQQLTLSVHWAGIVRAFDATGLHTGYVEAVNSLLQAAKAKARGYGTTDHFIAMAFLIAGKLTLLPTNPLHKARPLA